MFEVRKLMVYHPPAPISPKIEAERKFNSKRYNTSDKNDGNICGITAKIKVFVLLAPLAFNASTDVKSNLSISSTNNFPSIPTECIPKASTPENDPGPTALMKIRAITISGNTRITLNINLVIPVTGQF